MSKPVRLALVALAFAALESSTLAAVPEPAPPPRREIHGKAPGRGRRARLDGRLAAARASRATSAPKPVEERPAPPPEKAESVGFPNEGRLAGGAHLDLSKPYLRVVPSSGVGDFRWGLPELIRLIDRAARAVHKRYPGAVLDVGDISRKGGGDLLRHASHESGRDADLGFYVLDEKGKQIHAQSFIKFDASGVARAVPGARFDLERNWLFIQEMLTDPGARVSHIFISSPLRQRLLAHARARGVSRALLDRAAMVMMQPTVGLPHDDHMHVRISCPPSMRGSCIEIAKGAPRGHSRLAHKGHHVLRTPGKAAPSPGKAEAAAARGRKPALTAEPPVTPPKAPAAAAEAPAEAFTLEPLEPLEDDETEAD